MATFGCMARRYLHKENLPSIMPTQTRNRIAYFDVKQCKRRLRTLLSPRGSKASGYIKLSRSAELQCLAIPNILHPRGLIATTEPTPTLLQTLPSTSGLFAYIPAHIYYNRYIHSENRPLNMASQTRSPLSVLRTAAIVS